MGNIKRTRGTLGVLLFFSLLGCSEFLANPSVPAPPSADCLFDEDCAQGQICLEGQCQLETLPVLTEDGGSGSPIGPSGGDAGPAQGVLALSESGALEFGAQRLGVSVERALQLTNTGTRSLDLIHAVINNDARGEFQATPSGALNQELRPGESLEIVLEHTPKDATADFALFQVVHSGVGGIAQIELQAEFKGTPELSVSTDLYATESERINDLSFGELAVGSAASQKIYLRNQGAIDSIIALTDTRVTPVTGAFDLFPNGLDSEVFLSSFIERCDDSSDCPSEFPVCEQEVCVNDAGQAASTVQVEVFFAPQAAGTHEGILSVLGYDNNEADVTHDIALSGVGVVGKLVAEPSLLVFDEAYLGHPKTETVTFANDGEAPLTMVAVNLDTDGPFDELCPELPLVLNPGETADCDVSFLGTGTEGLAEGVLSATTDLDETVQVQVRAHVAHPPGVGVALLRHGESTPVPVVETASLPDVFLGHQKTSYLIVTNSGDSPLRVDRISFSSNPSSKFSFGAMPTFPIHLQPAGGTFDAGVPSPPGTPDAGPNVAASLRSRSFMMASRSTSTAPSNWWPTRRPLPWKAVTPPKAPRTFNFRPSPWTPNRNSAI